MGICSKIGKRKSYRKIIWGITDDERIYYGTGSGNDKFPLYPV